MQPRPYQSEAINSIFSYFTTNQGNPIVALPTGTGKSIVIAEFLRQVYQYYPGQRIMMLTHVKELIQQNYEKLRAVWPLAPAGIYSAGLSRRDTHKPITFAGIGSVYKRAAEFGRQDLVIVDECHLIPHSGDGQYRTMIGALLEANPHLKVIGLTATPYRLGGGLLTDGGLFNHVCYDGTGMEPFNEFFKEGYLLPPVPRKTTTELDSSSVRIQGGDFVQKDLQAAVDREEITRAAIDEVTRLASDRQSWLVFASGIEHAENINRELLSRGIVSAVVHSRMPKSQRDKAIQDSRDGKIRALVNNGVLTTGFDNPRIDCIVMLRPTNSPGLWVQMLGRGTRPIFQPGYDLATKDGRLASIQASPKQNCLVLDFAGNTARLGPINAPMIPRKKGTGGGTAPIKTCINCETLNHASARFCICCGEEFPRQVKIQEQASTSALVIHKKDLPVTKEYKVNHVTYKCHTKTGKPPSMQVTYHCGIRVFREWVCLEHGDLPTERAYRWWRRRSSGAIPTTTAEALSMVSALQVPYAVEVVENRQYPEVKKALFKKIEDQEDARSVRNA